MQVLNSEGYNLRLFLDTIIIHDTVYSVVIFESKKKPWGLVGHLDGIEDDIIIIISYHELIHKLSWTDSYVDEVINNK